MRNQLLNKFYKCINILVTKELPKNSIMPIAKEFSTKKLTFAVSRDNGKYTIWRAPLENDLYKKKYNDIRYNEIIEIDERLLQKRNFVEIYVDGNLYYLYD